jgi:hypothetical protein
MLWEEIERTVKGEEEVTEREIGECGHKAKIAVLLHPSGINPLANILNEKLKNMLNFRHTKS